MLHRDAGHSLVALPVLALAAFALALGVPVPSVSTAVAAPVSAVSNAVIGFQNPGATPPTVRFESERRVLAVNGREGESQVEVAVCEGATCLDIPTLNRFLGLSFSGDESTGRVGYSFFGLSVVGSIGSAEAKGPGGQAIELPCSPFVAGSSVYFPAQALLEALGMRYSEQGERIDVAVSPAQITEVKYNEDGQRFRTVIELAEPTPFFAVAAPSVISVGLATEGGFVPPGTVTQRLNARGQPVDDGPPPEIVLDTGGVLGSAVTIENLNRGLVRISAHGRYDVIEPQFFTLAAPSRIVMDFPKRWEQQRTDDPWEGIQKTWFSLGTPQGPVIAHVLYVKGGPDSPVRPKVVLAGTEGRRRETLSNIVRRTGALAGINGGYFAPTTGDPIGLLIADGEWVRFPYSNRSALLISNSGQLAMDRYGAQAVVTVGNRPMGVDGLNEWIRGEGNGLKLLTRRWGASWAPGPGQMCVQVRRGVVTQVVPPSGARGPEVPIPEDGFLIASQGDQNNATLVRTPTGTAVSFSSTLNPPMDGVAQGLGGGPGILRQGQWSDSGRIEGFGTDITAGRNPRTAVGVTASGDLILLVADGRRPGYSVGMTLREVAGIMARLGAVSAMALDSGGSSEMVVDGKVVNSPSDGRERPIPNALVFVPAS